MNAPFLGEYRHTLDEKGRVSIPSRFRPFLGDRFFLAKVVEPCLFVFPQEEWLSFRNNLNQMGGNTPKLRAFERKVFSGAVECAFDRAGRFVIPQHLRDYAKLNGEVIVVGVGKRMEIWDVKEWENYQNSAEEKYQGFSEEFDQLKL